MTDIFTFEGQVEQSAQNLRDAQLDLYVAERRLEDARERALEAQQNLFKAQVDLAEHRAGLKSEEPTKKRWFKR